MEFCGSKLQVKFWQWISLHLYCKYNEMFVYRYSGFVQSCHSVCSINQSCSGLSALTSAEQPLLSAGLYTIRYQSGGTLPCFDNTPRLLLIVCTDALLCGKAHARFSTEASQWGRDCASRNVCGRSAELFPLSWRGGTWSRVRTVLSGAGEQTAPLKGVSVRRCWPAALPTGGTRTKGYVHGALMQSLVMQKSWDRLSGWQTNGGALLILHQLCLIFIAHLNPRPEFGKISTKMQGPRPFLNPPVERSGRFFLFVLFLHAVWSACQPQLALWALHLRLSVK